MNLAFAINNDYIQHFFTALKSIEINNKKQFDIHILYLNLSNSNKSLIIESFQNYNFYWYDLSEFDFSDFYINAHINYETYFRIIIPEVIQTDKVLYLDSDILVRSDLTSLYNIDVSNNAVAACMDYKAQERKEFLNIPKEYNYFNAGILLINLDFWRKNHFTQKLVCYIKQMGNKLKYWDQDALNALLYEYVVYLDDCWNVQTASFESKEIDQNILENPYIVHFTGASKPWHISSNSQFKNEYLKYLKLTPFKELNYISTHLKGLLQRKSEIYIWGAGPTGEKVFNHLNINIIGFIDSNEKLVGKTFLGKKIYHINQIKRNQKVGIIVCSGHYREIANVLVEKGYLENEDFVHQM